MKCQICGGPAYPGQAYCQRCAYELSIRRPAPSHLVPPPQKGRTLKWLAGAAMALSALGVGALEARRALGPIFGRITEPARQVLGHAQQDERTPALQSTQPGAASPSFAAVQSEEGAAITQASVDSPAPVLSAAPIQEAQPVTGAPSDQHALPAEVAQWLEHLHKIEAERQSMSKAQVTRATTMLGGMQAGELQSAMGEDGDARQDRIADASRNTTSVQGAWTDLEQRFLAVNPPAECVPLQVAYDRTLKETGAMVSGILGAIQSSSQDQQGAIQALTQMQGQSTSRVDAPAKDADTLLGGIYARYGVSKAFSISSDVAL